MRVYLINFIKYGRTEIVKNRVKIGSDVGLMVVCWRFVGCNSVMCADNVLYHK